MRILSGVCASVLGNFSTSMDEDTGLLTARGGGRGASASGNQAAGAEGAGMEAGSSGVGWGPLQPDLTDDMRLAIQFRAEKKRLLKDALGVLAARAKVLLGWVGGGGGATGAGQTQAGTGGGSSGKGFGGGGRGKGFGGSGGKGKSQSSR